MMWLWLAGVIALASPLSPAAEERFAAAVEAEASGQWAQAAAHYGVLVALDGSHEAAILGLGRALEAQGDTATALRTYERLGSNPKGVEARAFLLESSDPLRSAELYRLQQSLQLGDAWPYLGEARALKRVDPAGAAAAIDGYLDLVQGAPKGSVILDVIGELRAANEDQLAERLMRRVLTGWPATDWVDEVQARLDRLQIERAARDFTVAEQTPLAPAERALLQSARRMAASKRDDEAIAALSELVRSVPSNPEPWGALGKIHRSRGDHAEAEVAFIRAISAAPNAAEWHANLGDLLVDSYGGKRDREARDAYRTALSLRPTWTEVAYRVAEMERGLRDYDAAVQSYRTVVAMDPSGDWGRKAQQRIQQLGRKAPEISGDVEPNRGVEGVSAEAAEHFRLARAYRAEEQFTSAIAEVKRAVELAPEWTGALNLMAALEVANGDRAAGRRVWEASLRINPEQPGVLVALGELASFEGDTAAAFAAYTSASEAGSVEALYRLAEVANHNGQTNEARAYLTRFFEQTAGGPQHPPAVALSATLEHQHQRKQLALGSALLGLGIIVAVLVWRRNRRKTLQQLLQRVPGAAHDVGLVVSAVRHELLKHNTSLLNEMAAALEEGDDAAVVYGAERLFGGPGKESVTSRYDAYLAQLLMVGRRHGMHLDLRHGDPVFGPISRSMAALYRIRRKLRVPPANATERMGLAGTVSAISHALNVDAYQELGTLLSVLSTCELSADLIARVDRRVRSEPGFATERLPKLEQSMPDGTVVSASRGDLEDVLTNLLRNALQALVEDGSNGDARIGLRVEHRTDAITGLLRADVAVLDSAKGHLSSTMIGEADVGRGLGLVRDLVERNGGTVRVVSEPGWSKAVVVELERVEGGVVA
ncbi:MAG: tetratricopeptide repeat protein [Myxococcota bacterium]|nr:tetratricopeptide repeat protein [Myxococcota bacterium]